MPSFPVRGPIPRKNAYPKSIQNKNNKRGWDCVNICATVLILAEPGVHQVLSLSSVRFNSTSGKFQHCHLWTMQSVYMSMTLLSQLPRTSWNQVEKGIRMWYGKQFNNIWNRDQHLLRPQMQWCDWPESFWSNQKSLLEQQKELLKHECAPHFYSCHSKGYVKIKVGHSN